MNSELDDTDPAPRPANATVQVKSCCVAGVVNIAALAIGFSASALPMQSPSAVTKPAIGNEGLQPRRIAQNPAGAFTVADISGTSGQSIPLSVSIADPSASRLGLLMFRGLPGQLKFTKGFRTGDTWLISLSELENAQLTVPGDFQGSFNMDVILVLGEGRQRHTRKISVNITSKVNAQTTDTAVQTPDVVREPAAVKNDHPPQTAVSPAVEKSLLDRAAQFLKNGDVAAARLLYERLAADGSALGALSMAKTYDPEVLSELDVVGMKPDVAMARRWYERAAALGNPTAATRLRALASSGR
jgi:hypothetical protein